jgi:DnaK suppressor protein
VVLTSCVAASTEPRLSAELTLPGEPRSGAHSFTRPTSGRVTLLKDRTMTTDISAPFTTPPHTETIHSMTTRTAPRGAARAVGPTAQLVALPQLDSGLPSTLSGVDDHLARIERARQAQLNSLPVAPSNVVTQAHRRIVARILEQVRDARARIREGTYGCCTHCSTPIQHGVLQREPWQPACPVCDPSAH